MAQSEYWDDVNSGAASLKRKIARMEKKKQHSELEKYLAEFVYYLLDGQAETQNYIFTTDGGWFGQKKTKTISFKKMNELLEAALTNQEGVLKLLRHKFHDRLYTQPLEITLALERLGVIGAKPAIEMSAAENDASLKTFPRKDSESFHSILLNLLHWGGPGFLPKSRFLLERCCFKFTTSQLSELFTISVFIFTHSQTSAQLHLIFSLGVDLLLPRDFSQPEEKPLALAIDVFRTYILTDKAYGFKEDIFDGKIEEYIKTYSIIRRIVNGLMLNREATKSLFPSNWFRPKAEKHTLDILKILITGHKKMNHLLDSIREDIMTVVPMMPRVIADLILEYYFGF